MAEDHTRTNPIDHSLVSSVAAEVRNVKKLVIGAGGGDVGGAARIFFQDASPTTRYDGSTLTADDNGSLWIDTNSTPDNQFNFLSDFSGPTWTPISTEVIATLLASARVFAAVMSIACADATLTLQNTDEEDTDGGRQSSLRFKGEQSGAEVTTLAAIEASHDGVADDQKGQLKIKVNDGDDNDAPSKVALTISNDGKIVAGESVAVLDEDNMATDSNVQLATQQSIKAYVDANDPTYAGGESHTFAGGLIIKMGVATVGTNATVDVTYGTAFPTAIISYTANRKRNDDTEQPAHAMPKAGETLTDLQLTNTGAACDVSWIAIGR